MAGALSRFLAKFPPLVAMMGVTAFAMLLPAAHAFSHHLPRTGQAFLHSALILAVLTALVGIALSNRQQVLGGQSGLMALLQAYLVLPFAMAMPFLVILPDTSFLNAWFEMVSSFTTTGGSVYDSNRLPPPLHLWRALVGWLGGLVTLTAASAILRPLSLGGAEVLTGRIAYRPLPSHEARLRIWQEAGLILPLYAGLTGLLWLGLLITGEHGLTALIHALGVLSTSGIEANYGLYGGIRGLAGEILMLFFMLFALSRGFLTWGRGGSLLDVSLRKDPELRLGLGLIGLVTAILMLRHFFAEAVGGESFWQIARAFWGAAFTAASFLTSTGYESDWWQGTRDWAGMSTPGLILIGLAVVGGGVATTAGGLKLLRIYALFLHGKHELEKIVHPSVVLGGGVAQRQMIKSGALMAWVFVMLFFIIALLILMVLTFLGMGFEQALIFTMAALSTTGALPELAGSVGYSWAALSDQAKVIFALTMILARVELLALIALISPDMWRRGAAELGG